MKSSIAFATPYMILLQCCNTQIYWKTLKFAFLTEIANLTPKRGRNVTS